MDHTDHVNLIREGVETQLGANHALVWADLGSGAGAFTLALADLLLQARAESTIYSIDRDAGALDRQRREMRQRFPAANVIYQTADFTRELDLPPLDGVIMANSLHFVRDKAPVLQRIHRLLKPNGSLVVVEYNTDRGNTWVPHPFSMPTWGKLAAAQGLDGTRKLYARPSSFLGEIYSAVSFKPAPSTDV